ncbi:MAG: N-acetylmuramoyl-L-alanine amidase [Peptostreptococcaceae bacterium]
MSDRNNGLKGKTKKKKRIRKSRVLLLVVIMGVIVFGIGKGLSFGMQVIKNIDKKGSTEIEETINQKHFDLEEEVNQDLGKKYTVLVDPGHGGNDKGTQSTDGKVFEKDVTLVLAKRIANKLSKQNDVQVIMSRTDDRYMSLADRAKMANSENVNAVISVHLNAEAGGNTAYGVETYYRKAPTDGSDKLASTVQKSIKSYVDIRDRGIREDNFQVLRETSMPAILIECGFLTNPTEAQKLLNEEYQESLTEGIVQGILSFLDTSKK